MYEPSLLWWLSDKSVDILAMSLHALDYVGSAMDARKKRQRTPFSTFSSVAYLLICICVPWFLQAVGTHSCTCMDKYLASRTSSTSGRALRKSIAAPRQGISPHIFRLIFCSTGEYQRHSSNECVLYSGEVTMRKLEEEAWQRADEGCFC